MPTIFQMADPIHQFEITRYFSLPVGRFDIGPTNSAGYMALAVILIIALFGVAASRGALVPSRLQSVGELGYEFVANMIRGVAGEDGLRFFPFVFTLFMFVLAANMIGMVPYAFTTTSHIAVTGALALLVIAIVIGYGLWKHGMGFFGLFAPSLGDMPLVGKILISMVLIPIEVISFIARPLTLALRLFANMLAGHIMLKLFAGFTVTLAGLGGAYFALAPLPFALAVALNALEFLVAFLQAYVFAILTCVYLNDALHPGHH